MRRYYFIFLCCVAYVLQAATPLTVNDIVANKYAAHSESVDYPMLDGESYAKLSGDKKQILKISFKTGAQTAVLFDVANTRGEKLNEIQNFIFSPDESRILLQTKKKQRYRRSFTAEYFIYTVANRTVEPLSKNGPQEQPLFSPDGNQIAFVRNNNLFLIKLLFNNSESQVTKDGVFNKVINGVPDWVNEEEFAFARAFDFSADGKMLAWIRYDESRVQQFDLQMYRGLNPSKPECTTYPGTYTYKYPKAGCDNAKVSVQTYDIKSHVIRTMNLPMDSDGYVPRIKFTETPDQLAIVTLNRHQNRMEIFMGNSRSLVCKLALRLEDEKYINEAAYNQLAFYGNHFALLSEKTGHQQLYWYTTTGQQEKQMGNGQDEITRFYGYDKLTGSFYYEAKDGSPLRTAVFKVDAKGKTKKLTAQPGENSAVFSANYKYFLHKYSNLTTPPVYSICDAEGKALKMLENNAELKQKLAQVEMAQKELFAFTTSEGVTLNGWMMKPANFDANRKYPVILFQYSGPGSQEVKDSWSAGFYGGGVFESYLCQKGFIVACVDGRGTGGRGAEFEKCTYLNLGVKEAKDQVETALYLGKLNYVDAQNIGIWGWSYGGFNTLMSMTEGRGVFKAGVAVAPVTDFRYYDTIYAERYMRTPQENGMGYDNNALMRANQLQGRLLICHGLADDNVHFQNTVEFAASLIEAGKQVDFQLYPNQNHSIRQGKNRLHVVNRVADYFIEHMK